MYSTQVYYYIPRQTVVLYDGTSSRRYQTVYAKNLKLHKGVDNKLQFQFINQEEKPMDISDKEITFRFISYDGTTVLLKKALTLVLPLTGIAQVEITAADTENIATQNGFYSLEIPVGSFDLPVFVDSDSGARGKLALVDSVLPSYVPSTTVTIPSHAPLTGNVVTFYSSQIATHENPVLTVQTQYTDFVGNVQLQGSTSGNDWYDIGSLVDFADPTTTSIGQIVTGFHPYIKLKFVATSGSVDNILVR